MGCNKSRATFLQCRPDREATKHKVVARRIAASKWRLPTSVRSRLLLEANRRKVCCSLRRNRLIRETSCQASSSLRKRMDQPHKLRAVAVCRPIRAAVSLYLLLLRSHSSLLRLLLAVASADHSPRNSCVI